MKISQEASMNNKTWVERLLDMDGIRRYPLGECPVSDGCELSYMEENLLHCLQDGKGHLSVDMARGTRLFSVLVGLAASQQVHNSKVLMEYEGQWRSKTWTRKGQESLIYQDFSLSGMERGIILCVKDRWAGSKLYHQIKEVFEDVCFLGEEESFLSREDIYKKKKLFQDYHLYLKKVHEEREKIEEDQKRFEEWHSLQQEIKVLEKDEEICKEEIQELNVQLEEALASKNLAWEILETRRTEIGRRSFFSRLLNRNHSSQEMQDVEYLLERYEDKEKVYQEILFKKEERQKELENLEKVLAALKESELDKSTEMDEYETVLRGRYPIYTYGKEKIMSSLEEIEKSGNRPWVGEDFLTYRRALYRTARGIIRCLSIRHFPDTLGLCSNMLGQEKNIEMEQAWESIIQVLCLRMPIVIVTIQGLEKLVEYLPKESMDTLYLYGGKSIPMEFLWQSLWKFKRWISFDYVGTIGVKGNIHETIGKENRLDYLVARGDRLVLSMLKEENLLRIEAAFEKGNYFSTIESAKRIGDKVKLVDVEGRSKRQEVVLQPNHGKCLQEILKAYMTKEQERFFDTSYQLYIVGATLQVVEEIVRYIRMGLFSHPLIRSIRQRLIVEEGMSGEGLDILKEWAKHHILSLEDMKEMNLVDKHIFFVLGSYHHQEDIGEIEEVVERLIYDTKEVAILVDGTEWQENEMMRCLFSQVS